MLTPVDDPPVDEVAPEQAGCEYIDGATAIVRGALEAGADFFAGYPITPASPILAQALRAMPRRGGVAIQAEDEIASIGMCLGAVLGGGRAFTATSGPGMSLYSENIGLAIMGEVPLVVVDVQRLGPATGGATTVGQGDVQFARWGTSGGFPIIALSPSTVAECRTLTMRAFDLAERFRCPVFVLTDKEMALTTRSVPVADLEAPVSVRARAVRRSDDAARRVYRYYPADGVPPLAHFGGDALVRFTGSSHDENGRLSKDPDIVGALNRHLEQKITAHADEIAMAAADLQEGARTLLISYGVSAAAMREGVSLCRKRGVKVSALTLHTLWPVPEAAIERVLPGIDQIVVAELNLGDYRREIERLAAGRCRVAGVTRVDGELITPVAICEAVG